jgi:hypothetical protein
MKKTVSGIWTARTSRTTDKLLYDDELLQNNNTRIQTKLRVIRYIGKRMPFCGEANSENLIDFGKLPSTEIIITMENEGGDEYLLLIVLLVAFYWIPAPQGHSSQILWL